MRLDLQSQLRDQVRAADDKPAPASSVGGQVPSLADIVGDFGSLIGVLLLLALVANVYVMFFTAD